MRVLGYIPARSGSKAVPNKNIVELLGVPLLEFSVFSAVRAKLAGGLDQVLVSTDSPEYLEMVSNYDIVPGYLRPKHLASDTSPTVDGIIHALEWLRFEHQQEFDAVMILQPTAPFRTPNHIVAAIQKLKSSDSASCVASVCELDDHHPMRIKKMNEDGLLQDFCDGLEEPEPSRRQDFAPPAYIRNGAIYLTRVKTIVEQQLIRGNHVIGMPMPFANSVNIDNHFDVATAVACLRYPSFQGDLSFFGPLLKRK